MQEGCLTFLTKVIFCDDDCLIPVHFHNYPHDQTGLREIRLWSGFSLGLPSLLFPIISVLPKCYHLTTLHNHGTWSTAASIPTLTHPHVSVSADGPSCRCKDCIITCIFICSLVIPWHVPLLYFLDDYIVSRSLCTKKLHHVVCLQPRNFHLLGCKVAALSRMWHIFLVLCRKKPRLCG